MELSVYFQRYNETLVNYKIVDLNTTFHSIVVDDYFICDSGTAYYINNLFEGYLDILKKHLDETGKSAFQSIKDYMIEKDSKYEDLTVEELIEMLE